MDTDILPDDGFKPENYQETDVFAWANNLVQYKDELKIELFFISKNYVLYKTALAEGLKKQLERYSLMKCSNISSKESIRV